MGRSYGLMVDLLFDHLTCLVAQRDSTSDFFNDKKVDYICTPIISSFV